MINDSSETIRRLIRLANNDSLDSQSRKTICELAEHIKNLRRVSQKMSELDMQLKTFRCADT